MTPRCDGCSQPAGDLRPCECCGRDLCWQCWADERADDDA